MAYRDGHGSGDNPCGYQQISSLSTATSLTVPGAPTAPLGAGPPTGALITCETASVRYRDDGIAPTTTVGILLNAGDVLFYTGNLAAIQFIAVSGSPSLSVAFYS
jgi:hypothetical protein